MATPCFPVSAFSNYAARLASALQNQDWEPVGRLAAELQAAWEQDRQVFICGNGGSAANALHWANDFLYPVNPKGEHGIRMHALPANSAVLTCLGNDIGYDGIFSRQLSTLARAGDLLIVLSGSGNSPNILRALERAREMKVKTAALLGYSGGAARKLADLVIHFQVNDMQIAEDMQLIAGHMILQSLRKEQDFGTK